TTGANSRHGNTDPGKGFGRLFPEPSLGQPAWHDRFTAEPASRKPGVAGKPLHRGPGASHGRRAADPTRTLGRLPNRSNIDRVLAGTSGQASRPGPIRTPAGRNMGNRAPGTV